MSSSKSIRVAALLAALACLPLQAPSVIAGPPEKRREASTCKATRWPFSRSQPRKDLLRQMERLERPALIEYYFGELSQPQAGASVAEPLALYLAQTEHEGDLRTFFRFLAKGAGLEEHPESPTPLQLVEICSLYGQVLAGKR